MLFLMSAAQLWPTPLLLCRWLCLGGQLRLAGMLLTWCVDCTRHCHGLPQGQQASSLCRVQLLNIPGAGCCSFSHPVGDLNETSVQINDGAGIIEGINSSDASGNALCGAFTIRGKVPFDPWATLQVRQRMCWLAKRS